MTYFYTGSCLVGLLLLAYIAMKVSRPTIHNEGIINNEDVLAAIRKARDLNLEATNNKRQQELIAIDTLLTDSKEIKRDVSWLRSAWSRFSGK